MSLAVHFVWENAYTFSEILISISPFRYSRRKSFIRRKLQKLHILSLFQKVGNGSLILLRGKGTGRIKKKSAGTEHICRLKNQFPLYSGQFMRFFRSPVFCQSFFLSEHSLSGAGSIQKDFVEKFRELFCKAGRRFICDKTVGNAEKLQIAKQRPGS